jgi:hypothetical protein
MAIVMISSLFQGGRKELAQALAHKTNWPVLSREELQEQAKQKGIKVGRLEVSMIKRPTQTEKLAREKNLYRACITSALCEKALQGSFIYYGRAGHLLLPGVDGRLRVGLTVPQEVRIQRTAKALELSADRAETYLKQLDDDIDKWIRYIHHASGQDPNQFDVFLNLEHMSLANATETLYLLSQLPEYQSTPGSTRFLKNLYLASEAELRLGLDERTRDVDLRVQAENGVVTVTYPPHQSNISDRIGQALSDLSGCREIQCTMAETNILWVQEKFNPQSENFQQIIHLSQRWGAAVELMRLINPEEVAATGEPSKDQTEFDFAPSVCSQMYDGGVEDDDPDAVLDDGGLATTMEELVNKGRCGGGHSLCGGYDRILERVRGEGNYALVVIGDMFLSKGQSTRTRRTREFAMSIRDRLKAPVITADELKSRFLFGKRQAFTLVGFTILVALLYMLVFTHEDTVKSFLSGSIHEHLRWLTSLGIFLFVPLIAYLYGAVTGLALKIINID